MKLLKSEDRSQKSEVLFPVLPTSDFGLQAPVLKKHLYFKIKLFLL